MSKLQLNNNIDIDLDHYTTELEQNISDLNVIQNNLNSLIYNWSLSSSHDISRSKRSRHQG